MRHRRPSQGRLPRLQNHERPSSVHPTAPRARAPPAAGRRRVRGAVRSGRLRVSRGWRAGSGAKLHAAPTTRAAEAIHQEDLPEKVLALCSSTAPQRGQRRRPRSERALVQRLVSRPRLGSGSGPVGTTWSRQAGVGATGRLGHPALPQGRGREVIKLGVVFAEASQGEGQQPGGAGAAGDRGRAGARGGSRRPRRRVEATGRRWAGNCAEAPGREGDVLG